MNDCVCFFMQFDRSIVCQPGEVFDVTGTFEYSHSPTTGTIDKLRQRMEQELTLKHSTLHLQIVLPSEHSESQQVLSLFHLFPKKQLHFRLLLQSVIHSCPRCKLLGFDHRNE